jgi:hypothetical protein
LLEVRLMNKKAQGISLNVIIIAAIALLVLVILSVIFMGRMGTFTDKSKDCASATGGNGQCLSACEGDHPTEVSIYTCPTTTDKCCVKPA